MRFWIGVPLAVVLSLAVADIGFAQAWRGMGRVAGKVVDAESGQPVEGVAVKAVLPTAGNAGPSESKTNTKGEWAIGGVARGNWALDFVKEGYETRSISIAISEVSRIPPMTIELKKAAPVVDPNAEIKAQLTKAGAMMNAKQYAEARAIYEGLVTKYPEVKQFRPLIARTYYGEGNKEKAIEELRKALEADPENVEVRMLLGNTLVETGQAEEGRKLLEGVDATKVNDPAIYVNVGIELINKGQHGEAVGWFDKAIAQFPDAPDAYYYRGISNVSLGKPAEAKADLEKFVSLAPPDAPEVATARKLIEQMK
jgi:tetratricopeptide (TPR) repeat protein